MAREGDLGVRRAALAVALLALIFFLSLEDIKPPAPKPANAPASEFSAARAFNILNRLLGDDFPHPVGSPADDAVRNRIIAELKNLGYAPQVQTAFTCGQYGSCATVSNVVALLRTSSQSNQATSDDAPGGPSVLVSAHYDSVPAGPGASDDGVGVAALLETARALKSLPPPKHPVVLLVTDGEEGGLLGARAFMEFHPWARTVRAAVNLDARGTSGASIMFETGDANEWAVRLFGQHVPHPSLSSISYTVYKRLPNDTDFSVFKSAGAQGLNFAFIGDVSHYHTPLDNIANANPASLQHQGENALASVTALANADFSTIPIKEAVYFDLFQSQIIRFRATWAVPLAIVCIVLLAVQIAWLFRTNRLSLNEFFWGLSICLGIIAITAILAYVLRTLLRFGSAILVDWVAHPVPVQLAFWSLAIGVLFTVGILFGRCAAFWGLWSSLWTCWSILSLIFAWAAPGISYLFLIPLLVGVVSSLPAIFLPIDSAGGQLSRINLNDRFATLSAFLALAATAAAGFAAILLLYQGLGNRVLPFIAIFVAVQLTPVLPLCADISNAPGMRGALFAWIPISVSLTAAFFTLILPQFSAKSPQRVNIEYWKDADTNVAQWIVEPASGRLPEPINVAASFKRADKGPFPWDRGPAFVSPAPRLASSAPSFTILASSTNANERRYRALLKSERGASEVVVLFPPKSGVSNVSMQGQSLDGASEKEIFFFGDWNVYRCLAVPSEGVEMVFTLPSGKPLQIFVVDVSYGLPTEGKFLLDSRPLTAVPSQDGDVSLVSRSVQFIP